MRLRGARNRSPVRSVDVLYICLCNALTDRQITKVAREQGVARPSEVYESCGCRAKCGQCVHAILGLLQEVTAVPSALVQAAE